MKKLENKRDPQRVWLLAYFCGIVLLACLAPLILRQAAPGQLSVLVESHLMVALVALFCYRCHLYFKPRNTALRVAFFYLFALMAILFVLSVLYLAFPDAAPYRFEYTWNFMWMAQK